MAKTTYASSNHPRLALRLFIQRNITRKPLKSPLMILMEGNASLSMVGTSTFLVNACRHLLNALGSHHGIEMNEMDIFSQQLFGLHGGPLNPYLNGCLIGPAFP
jgi:hypothetical protein